MEGEAGCQGWGWFQGPRPPRLGVRPHLDEDVVVAGRVHDVIADEHQVGVLVGQGPQPVIVFLPWNRRAAVGQGGTPASST